MTNNTPKSYIDTMIDEVLGHESVKFANSKIAQDAIRRGTNGYEGETFDVPIRKAFYALIEKCKEAIPEEQIIDWTTDVVEKSYRNGWNDNRIKSLEALNNLK